MPYGIPNETEEQTAKMESCVAEVMHKQPKLSKSSAIAICKSSLGYVKKSLPVLKVKRGGCPC